MQLWHILNGSKLAAALSLFMAISGCASLYFKMDHFSLLFSIGFYTLVASLLHLSSSREKYMLVLHTLIEAAQDLETHVNHRQMRKMMKFTRALRILLAFHFVELCFHIVMVCGIPLLRRTLGAPMPFLPVDPMYFWSSFVIESIVATMGILAFSSAFGFIIEVSLCLTCLFDILGECFREVTNCETVPSLIRIHQLLLDASTTFKNTVPDICFNIVWNALFMTIIVTYVVTAVSFQMYMVAVVASFFAWFCAACLLGQLVAKSSFGISFSVYESDWIYTLSQLRKDLSLIILRSKQKPACLEAGLFGNLDFKKILWFIENWYKMVQALLNLI